MVFLFYIQKGGKIDMWLLPVVATVLLSITTIVFTLLLFYMKRTKANGINLVYYIILAQIVGIVTIWLLYINI